MAKKSDVYVDTSAFIAFLDRSDSYHQLFLRRFADPPGLITTSLVVAEGHAWFLRRYDRHKGLQFLAMIEDLSPLQVMSVGAAEQSGAIKMLRKFSDQNLTLTDGLGLHLMETQKLKHCWSTDFHLGLTGATLAINDI